MKTKLLLFTMLLPLFGFSQMKWISYAASFPTDALAGGYTDEGTTVFVCRADYMGGTHPGFFDGKQCRIGYGGSEVAFDDFEILTDPDKDAKWEKWTGIRPKNALAAGHENSEDLMACQAYYGSGLYFGKVVAGMCNISYKGKEIVIKNNFKVLVSKSKQNVKEVVEKIVEDNTNNKIEDNIEEGLNIGNRAPEINLTSPEGKNIKLSSLRGKYVLIDFWASWCGPCRYVNPQVVALFHKFKHANFLDANGFTIYSVSLDNNINSWKTAIKKDNLEWPSHVSDLNGWASSAAQEYNVDAIPTNFFIDANGVIVAVDLSVSAIENLLSSKQK